MVINDLMLYIESEMEIINNTPCELCGGNFIVEEQGIEFIEGYPHTVNNCACEICGSSKSFEFSAPFLGISHADDNSLALLN